MMTKRIGLVFGVLVAATAAPANAAEFADPTWPCIQRKVEQIAMFQMWPGPMPEGDWEDDPEVERVATSIAPRRVPMEEVEDRVAAYLEGIPEPERGERAAQLFNAVLDLIQGERAQVMGGIGRYARSQAALSEQVEEEQLELVRLNEAEDAEKNWDRIEELEDKLAWDTRIYRERAQSLQYVCETPVLLEQRAFAIARVISGMI
jgi:hypothetical protein